MKTKLIIAKLLNNKYLNSNELKTASKGTGDNAYIYYNNSIAGTIPISEKSFVISGAIIDPLSELRRDFQQMLALQMSVVNDITIVFAEARQD